MILIKNFDKFFKYRIAVFFVLVFLVNCLIVHTFVENLNTVKSQIGVRAARSANMVAMTINRSYLSDYLIVMRDFDHRSDSYRRVKGLFEDCKNAFEYRYVFSFHLVNGGDVLVYGVDSESDNSPCFSYPGTQEKFFKNPGRVKLIANKYKPQYDVDYYADPLWGEYISGYAPIWDAKHSKVIGFVGADAAKSKIDSYLHPIQIRYTILLIGVNFCFFVVFVFSLWIYYSFKWGEVRKQNQMEHTILDKINFPMFDMDKIRVKGLRSELSDYTIEKFKEEYSILEDDRDLLKDE